jgi:predicted dinucleotide-utilizing enzyme
MKTIAVIGCGRIAKGAHFPALAKIEDVRIKYACDLIIEKAEAMKEKFWECTHPGIDGILVTVGLCIIALVLCMFMKEQLQTFIQSIVTNMTGKAQQMLDYTPGA